MDLSVTFRFLPLLLQGAVMTVEITAISITAGIFLGLIAALGRLSSRRLFSIPATFYVTVIRGTPLLIQILLVYNGLAQFGINFSAMTSGLIALSINSGAYVAEIFRAAIQSIDKGQTEAALSLGMNYGQAMRRIILPQGSPGRDLPVGNEFIALLKDSSLVSVIGIYELMRQAQQGVSITFRPLEVYTPALLIYLILTSVFSVFAHRLEKQLSVYD
ncbi:MAG: amino acid ABC transporter permease [Firmicutes bacterium]|nr:amino acid ABC transporter permease [Bacillota bacterium]